MRDNRRYTGAVRKNELLGYGASANVYSCDYFDTAYVYKEFWQPEYIKFINEKIKRISEYYGSNKNCTYPYMLIYKHPEDIYFVGYVLDLLYKYKDIDSCKDINILKRCRDIIDKFHNETNCVHTDITPWNLLYKSENNDIQLIDFDTNISLKYKDVIDLKRYNIMAVEYLKHVGVDKGLDIFLYNLTIYSILNNVQFFNVLEHIHNDDYGVFEDNSHVKEIYKSYQDMFCGKSLKKEYVIDYI